MSEEGTVYLGCPHCGTVMRREEVYVDGSVICPDCLTNGRKEH